MEWFMSGFQRPTSTTPNRIRSSLPLSVGRCIHIHGSAFPSKMTNGKPTLRRGSLHASMDLCTSNNTNNSLIARGVQCVLLQRPGASCSGWQGSPQREERWKPPRSQSCDAGRGEGRESEPPLRAGWGINQGRRRSQGEVRGREDDVRRPQSAWKGVGGRRIERSSDGKRKEERGGSPMDVVNEGKRGTKEEVGRREDEVRRPQSGWRSPGGRIERSSDGKRTEDQSASPTEVWRRNERGGLDSGTRGRRDANGRSLSLDSSSLRGGSLGMRKRETTPRERPTSSWGVRHRRERPTHHDRRGQENDRSQCNTDRRGETVDLREASLRGHASLGGGGISSRPQSCVGRGWERERPYGGIARAGGWRPQPSRPSTAPPEDNTGLTIQRPSVGTPETPRCRAIWTGPELRSGTRIVDGQQVPESDHSNRQLPPSLHLYLPSPNEPEDADEQPAEGGELTEERCSEGNAETNSVPDIAVSQPQHERDDKYGEDDTTIKAQEDIFTKTEVHVISGNTPKDDNTITATADLQGDLDHEESTVANHGQKTLHVKGDQECNTTCDLEARDQALEPEDERHQSSNGRPSGGSGRRMDDSNWRPTHVPAAPKASFEQHKELAGNTDKQEQDEGHATDRSPEAFEKLPKVNRSTDDEQSQGPLEEKLMTNENCDGETSLNEDNRQWETLMAKKQKGVEENDRPGGGFAEKQNVPSIANKLRYVWGHKKRMRERGKSTETRSRVSDTGNHLHSGQKHARQGDTERTQLPTSSLVYPQTATNKCASTCFLPSFYATWSGYQVRACGVKQAVWPLTKPPRVTSNTALWTTRDMPEGVGNTVTTARFQCSRREGVPAEPQLSLRGAEVEVDAVPKTKTTKTLVWGPQGPREIKSVWVLPAHHSRWRNSN